MLLFSFSYHRLFIIFFFSLSLFVDIFFSSLSIAEKEKKASFYCCCLFSLFLSFSAENTSCFCIYIYINQKKCERLRADSFSCCIGQIWPRHYYYPDSSIRFCVCLRTRIECAYTYTRTKRNHQ